MSNRLATERCECLVVHLRRQRQTSSARHGCSDDHTPCSNGGHRDLRWLDGGRLGDVRCDSTVLGCIVVLDTASHRQLHSRRAVRCDHGHSGHRGVHLIESLVIKAYIFDAKTLSSTIVFTILIAIHICPFSHLHACPSIYTSPGQPHPFGSQQCR